MAVSGAGVVGVAVAAGGTTTVGVEVVVGAEVAPDVGVAVRADVADGVGVAPVGVTVAVPPPTTMTTLTKEPNGEPLPFARRQ